MGVKTGWRRELVQCWGCWRFMLGACFVSTLPVCLPSFREIFRPNFVLDIGKSWGCFVLVSVAVACEFLNI